MITAAEAKAFNASMNGALAEEAKRKIDEAVKKKLDQGESKAWVYGSHNLLLKVVQVAEAAGYKVTHTQCQRDGDSIQLEWDY